MAAWYTRSVFFVSKIEMTREFYLQQLNFTEAWNHEENGEIVVAQVNRENCEIILAVDVERAGKSRLFIALEKEEMDLLSAEIESNDLSAEHKWWGYPVIEIQDPDGNELLFSKEE